MEIWLTFGRLVLAVWSGEDWLVFYEVLRPIPTYTEGPQIFKKIVIALLYANISWSQIVYTTPLPHDQEEQADHIWLTDCIFQILLVCGPVFSSN